MAQTAKDKFIKMIEKIKEKYTVTENGNVYTVSLGETPLELILNDDESVKVKLLDEECITQAPFKIVKKIVSVNWEPCTYTRRVGWTYNTWSNHQEYGGDGDVMCDAVDGFRADDVRPRHFEDDYCSLDVETCSDVSRHCTGKQSFEISVEFVCAASREQLENINDLFDENVIGHIDGFFADDGIDGDIMAGDYFYKE